MQVHYEEKATMKSLVIVRLERNDDLEACHDDRLMIGSDVQTVSNGKVHVQFQV